MGWIFGAERASTGLNASAHSILKKESGVKRHKARVKWRTHIVGEDGSPQEDAKRLERTADLAPRARLLAYFRSVRLPALVYELIILPMRIAYDRLLVETPALLVLDLLVDTVEAAHIVQRLRERAAWRQPEAAAAKHGRDDAVKDQPPLYSRARLIVDVISILLNYVGRLVHYVAGTDALFIGAQLLRIGRIHDLAVYMADISADLSTNTAILAVSKFALVAFAVPHWISCGWWASAFYAAGLSEQQSEVIPLPSWVAQFEVHTGNSAFADVETSLASRYLITTYFAWLGLTSNGYADIKLAGSESILFCIAVMLVQVVFYAFVLGTLFHFLVRTDDSTAKFKDLLKAVGDICAKHELPKSVSDKVRAYYVFQHSKQASGTFSIFNQLPVTLKVKVASAQYFRHVAHAWVFRGCNVQLLNQVVIALKELYVMPLEVLLNKGDGSRELFWVVDGSLSVKDGDVHIATLSPTLNDGTKLGDIVGEIAFFLRTQQPYTVAATAYGDVTLLVLPGVLYEETIASYPEQQELIMTNIHRKYGLDEASAQTQAAGAAGTARNENGGGGGSGEEQDEFEALRLSIRKAIAQRAEDMLTQMMFAASSGDVETVRMLASQGLKLDNGNYDGRTTLHVAAAEGNLAVVALLCDLGAATNVKDRWGLTPLVDAITHKHDAVAAKLLAEGAQLELDGSDSLLFAAVSAGDTQRIASLLSFGVEIDVTTHDKRTALHHAATIGQVRVVEYLISRLADVNKADRRGWTPLDDAIHNQHQIVMQMLKLAGSIACESVLATETIKAAASADVDRLRFLVEAGASINVLDVDMRTPLHLSVCAGSISTVQYLVFANADVEKLDRRSNSPLVDALNHSNEAAAILVSYCGLQLPSKQRAEKNLVAIMDGARAQDMSATNRKLRFRTHLREKAIEDSQRRQRELGHAFNTLAHDLSVLTRHFTTIYDALDERASRWLEAYTDADEGSDGDSAASSQDIDPADFVDDDNASDTSSIGAAVDCRRQSSAAGGLRNSAGTANEQAQPAAQLRDAAPHASAADGGAPLPPQVELPPHPGESAKTFIAIVLRLPQAERGLSWLRKQYEESLPSDGGALRSLPPAERMREEERVLDELLTAKLLLEPDEAQHVREEIYEQIGHITGGAERRKTSIFGAERRGSAGGAERYQPGVSDNLPAADAAARAGGVPAGAAGTADFSAGGKLDERSADSPLPVRRASVPSAQPPALGTPTGAAAPGMYLAEMGYAALFCSPLLVAKLAALSTRKFGMRDRLGTGAAASADAPDGGATLTPNARGLVPGTAEHAAALRNGDALDGGSPLPSPAARRASKRPAWLTTTPLRSSCASRTPSDDATAVGGALAASAGIGGGGTIVPLDTQAADALRALESRTRPAPYGGEARRGRVRTWGAAESSMRLSSPGSGAGSPVGRGELLYSRRRIRASETISAERLLVAAEAARVRKDGGYDVLHDDARRDAIEACAVLSALFGVFDRTGRGKIRLSDVRLLQGALGEMGSSEIQSLVAFLVEAAQTLNPARRKRAAAARAGAHYVDTSGAHAERRSSRTFRGGSDEDEELRVARKLRVLTRVQFFVGAASWVLASLNDEDGADVDASHARAPRAGGLAAAVAAADAAAAARRHGAPWRIYDAKADVAAALSDLDERDASASLRRLHEALLSAAALRALADALTDRIVGKKLDGRRAVEPEALLALTKHVVAIPVGTRALDLLGWARETLRLPLSDAPSGPSQLGLALAGAPALHFASGEGMSRGGERRGSIAASEAAADRRASNAASTAGLIAAGARTPPGRTTWAHLATALGERASALMDDPVDGGAGTDGVNSKLPHARALDVLQRLIAPRDDGSASIDVSGAAAAGNDRRWFIVDHRSPLCLGYRALFETFAVFDALFIPLQLCFYAEISRMAWVHRVNLCTDVFYWGQVALRFLTTFVNEKSVTVTSPADIRRQYLATDFLVDTVAFWPQNYLAGVLGASTFDSLALRLFRMLAARYPYGSYRNWEKSRADIKLSTGIAQQLVLIAIGVHMLACVYTLFSYSVGSTHATPGSWAARYDEQLYALQATESTLYRQTAEGRLLRKYEVSVRKRRAALVQPNPRPCSRRASCAARHRSSRALQVMFVLQALTRTGQTQLPSSYGEICFLVLLMILSVTAFAWAIGRISTLVMKQDNEIVTKRTALQQVQGYIAHTRVPADLAAEIAGFFHTRLKDASSSSVRGDSIIAALPVSLQIEIGRITHRHFVVGAALFHGCSDGFVDRLASLLRERRLEPDQVLFRTTELCKELAIITLGAVRVFDDPLQEGGEQGAVATLVVGETIGDVAFIFGLRHFNNASCESDGPATLATLSLDDFKLLLKVFPAQEDVLMDNAMMQFDGVSTSRSGRSVTSARTGKSGRSAKSRRSTRSGRSTGSSYTASNIQSANASSESAIQAVISTARVKRNNMHTVRLCSACAIGDVSRIQRLLSAHQIDVNRGDYDCRRPLHIAASRGHTQAVELLVASKADLSVLDRNGRTPLAEALANRHNGVSKALVRHGAEALIERLVDKLCRAAANTDALDELTCLLQGTADAAALVDESLRTPLHVAAAAGNAEHMNALISASADVNATDRYGVTPLHDAFRHEHEACSALLLGCGATMGAKFDQVSEMCKAASADDVPQLKRLLQHRCDINAENYDGRTALHLAAATQKLAACTFILSLDGVRVNFEDRYGETAYDDALRTEGKLRQVVSSLIAAFGGKRGSKVMRPSAERARAEQAKALVDLSTVESMRTMVVTAMRLGRWTTAEVKSARALAKRTSEACELEDDEGPVLADARPTYLHAVCDFAQEHHQRTSNFVGKLKPLLHEWQKMQDQYGTLKQEIQRRLSTIINMQEKITFALDSLREARFRAPSASA